MKVAVIGPGAMGCLCAARLARSGVGVLLVDHDAERAARLRETGIALEDSEGTFAARPAVALAAPPDANLIIVLTKAYSTADVVFPPAVPVLTLQNGLGNVETIAEHIGADRVLAGATCEGATLLGEGRVRHRGAGPTEIGSWTRCPADLAVHALQQAGFQVELTDNPSKTIWEKAVINAGINPVTALLDVPNGKLLEIPEARQLMRDLVEEACLAAQAEGHRFESPLVQRVEEVCENTSANLSSMLQDVRAGRRTEIDAISGAILRRARAAAIELPCTQIVWHLVKSLEQR